MIKSIMKILIGTPIHQVKDYSMEKWLKNVAKLKLEYSADLILVDNSPGTEYMETVKGYCTKYGITNYKIVHIDFDQGMSVNTKDKRIETAQKIIREEVLSHDYDAWFSWECDQIIPVDALNKLVELMNIYGVMMVAANSWARNNPAEFNPDMGVTLIAKECLEKHGFLLKGDTDWQGNDRWFKERVLKSGGNYIDVYGVINPVYHLDKLPD